MGKRVPVMSAVDAVKLVKDEDVVAICGAGGGITEPTCLINALAERYHAEKKPRDLTLYYPSGPGDRADKGLSPLAQPGMVKGGVAGHWGQSPRLAEMAERNEIEAYNFPMGVMSQLLRAGAAGQPGILTHVGLGTFLDPDQQGGKMNERTREDLIKKMDIDGTPYLYYKTIFPDVAFIRGTTADTEGYITMEDEVTFLDVLAMAMSTHNHGGKVLCQVQKVVKAGTLHPKNVKIPGYLVDGLIINPNQTQLYQDVPVNRFMSGDYIAEEENGDPMQLSQRKVVARRALMAVHKGDVGNVGVGICDGIGIVAQEEGLEKEFTLTVETGPIGGVTAQGIFFGASVNMKAVLDMPSQFDFYDGGGLDVCFLSFAEMDRNGNVNVHKFNGKIMGTGGFVNICQNSKRVVFCGTLRAGGLKTRIADNKITIEKEGRFLKMVDQVSEITFNGMDALARGQEVLYITERAVFCLTEQGVMLTEVAPGVDVEKDIIKQMGFKPVVADDLKMMDSCLFSEGTMCLPLL